MTRDEIAIAEVSAQQACRTVIENVAPQLQARGLACDGPLIETVASELSRYCSELRVTVVSDKGIVDIVEFFIIEDGRIVVSATEAADYLRRVLDEMTTGD